MMPDAIPSDLVAQVLQLTEDITVLKQELNSARWEQVAKNFQQIADNFGVMNARIERLEQRLAER